MIGWVVAVAVALISRTVVVQQARTKDASYELLQHELSAKDQNTAHLLEQVRSAMVGVASERQRADQAERELTVCRSGPGGTSQPATQRQVEAAGGSNSPKTTAAASDKVFASGVEFNKPTCSQRAGYVRCKYTVTNRAEKGQTLQIEIANISGSSFFCYLVDATGSKHYANDAQIGGIAQHIWQREKLDPDVPVVATLIFEIPKGVTAPLAVSMNLRIQPVDDPNLPNPQDVVFRNVAVEVNQNAA